MNVSVQDILKARVNMQTFEVEQYASSADVKSINTIKVNQNGRVSRSSIFDVVNRNSNSAPNVQSHYATKSGGFDASTFRKSTGSFAERRAAAGIFSPDAKAKIRSVGKFQKLRRAGEKAVREYDDIDQHEERTLELLRNKLGKLLVVQMYVNKKEGFKIKFHVR